jgi:hypothetical protein
MGGGTGVQPTCDTKILGRCKLQNSLRGVKEKTPWEGLRVYIIQQMQGQSKAEDIVVSRKTLHSTSKVMRLNGESFSMSGSFSAIAAVSAKCQK